MHVSLFHANYTPLPWIFFSTLYSFEYVQNNELKSQITIPEFFVFGISKEINTEDSFYYQSVTENSRGSAVIRFDLLDDKKRDYNLRFDVSHGEKFLHIDFGYYDGKMTKLLSHFPIDMKKVQEFSKRMFVSLMSAGFYDPDFAKILKNKLKNTAEIIKQYKELSEPLKIMHLSDEKATGTNKTVGMNDEIQDEQDYKKRMLYVDYLNPNVKKSQYSDIQGWLNPLHIWMLNHIGEYDSMHALKTKFQELKQDFEFANNNFRESELFKNLSKFHLDIPSPTTVGTFLQDHFQLRFVVTSIGVKGYDVEIQIRASHSQTWINDSLIKTIQFDVKKYFICNKVSVELSTK